MNLLQKLLWSAALLACLTTSATADTLDQVQRRLTVYCGVGIESPGFAFRAGDTWKGLYPDLCRAVAAAVLGSTKRVEFVELPSNEQIPNLLKGKTDLLAYPMAWNLTNDFDEDLTMVGPLYFDGLGFMLERKRKLKSALELDRTSVCVVSGSHAKNDVVNYFATHQMKLKLVDVSSDKLGLQALLDKQCDVLAGPQSQLHQQRRQLSSPSTYKVLPEIITKAPLGVAMAAGHDNWRKVVQWTIHTMVNAEELGINAANVQRIRENADSEKYKRFLGTVAQIGGKIGLDREWAYRVIKQVGNYDELYQRNFGAISSLRISRGLNALWRDGGLMIGPSVE